MVVSCGLAAELHYARKLPEQGKGIRISQNVSRAKPKNLTFRRLWWSSVLTFSKSLVCFILLVLLVLLVVLERFAGIKPATRSSGKLRLQLLQITLLPVHQGP